MLRIPTVEGNNNTVCNTAQRVKKQHPASELWHCDPNWHGFQLNSLCEAKVPFFVQPFLQSRSSPRASSGVGHATQMLSWGLARLGREEEGRISPLSFSFHIVLFHSFPEAQAAPVWIQGMNSPHCHIPLPRPVAAGRAVPYLGICVCHRVRRTGRGLVALGCIHGKFSSQQGQWELKASC